MVKVLFRPSRAVGTRIVIQRLVGLSIFYMPLALSWGDYQDQTETTFTQEERDVVRTAFVLRTSLSSDEAYAEQMSRVRARGPADIACVCIFPESITELPPWPCPIHHSVRRSTVA